MNNLIKNDPETFAFRFLWCAAVVFSNVLFFYQAGSRVQVYFQYKANVDVQVKYVPAVTVCNQNSYRFISNFMCLQETVLFICQSSTNLTEYI